MKLPSSFNYAEAFLTLRCNLGCSYCINNDSGIVRGREELTADQWATALNKIDFGIPLTLGGGEPTLHKGFYDLLDRLRPDIKIDLLTNLQFDIPTFLSRTMPERFNGSENPAYRSIRVSYHPEQMEPNKLVEDVRQLQDKGYSIGIFGLNHPENMGANVMMSELARKEQVYFFIKDFLGKYKGKDFGFFKYPRAIDGTPKIATCRTRELLMAPNGNVYRCHRDLYHAEGEVGNITDEHFEIEDKRRFCDNFGLCNPCDVKLKTNRFLQQGQCSVDIKEGYENYGGYK